MSIDIRLSKRKFLSFGKSYKKKLFIGNRKKKIIIIKLLNLIQCILQLNCLSFGTGFQLNIVI
jgi:hypothetical protein